MIYIAVLILLFCLIIGVPGGSSFLAARREPVTRPAWFFPTDSVP